MTSVYVTHDQTEAMTLGQRVAVMRDGKIVQTDAPQHLYESPRDLFVAAFIGSPAMNLVEATIDGDEVEFGQFRVPLDPARRPAAGSRRRARDAARGVRGAALAAAELPRLDVRVELLEELGSEVHAIFQVTGPRVVVTTRDTRDETAGLIPDENALFTARLDPRTTAPTRGPLQLAVDPSGFHFFDIATGASLLEPTVLTTRMTA